MVQGRLEDGVLTLWVDGRVYQEHGGQSLPFWRQLARRLASAQAGVPVRCAVKVGKAPAGARPQRHPRQAAEHGQTGRICWRSAEQFDNIIIQE